MARTKHSNAKVEVIDLRTQEVLHFQTVNVSKAFKTHHAHKALYQAARDLIIDIAEDTDRDIESFGFKYEFDVKVNVSADEAYHYHIVSKSIHPWSYMGTDTNATLVE